MVSYKEIIQRKVVEALLNSPKGGIITLATGTGKTKAIIDYLRVTQSERVLWVVPTIRLRDEELPTEFSKWGASSYFKSNVECICYKSLPKRNNNHYNVVVLDEAHRITPHNAEFFSNNTYDQVVCLTATFPKEQEKTNILYKKLGLPHLIDVKIPEAIDKLLVSDYTIKLIGIPLSTIRNIKVKRKAGNSFYTSEQNSYNYFARKIAESEFPPKQLLLARMKTLYAFESKMTYAKKMLDKIPPDKRTLIFTGTIDQANRICPNRFHSKTTEDDLNKFNSKIINKLSVVQAFNEGHNPVDVDAAYILQVDSNTRNLIQRIGRCIRYRKGHTAEIFIFYYKNTIDEIWLNKSLKDIKNGVKH